MIKIAILTPKNSYFFIKDATRNLDAHFEFIFYDDLNLLSNIYSSISHKFDGIITSGPIGFEIIKKRVNIVTPLYYFEISKSDLYKYIFKIFKDNSHLDFSKVYIDFISYDNKTFWLEDMFDDKNSPIFMPLDYSNSNLYKNLEANYIKLKNNQKIDLILTRISNMLPFLEKLGIPYHFLFPSKNTIIEILNMVIKDIKAKKYENKSIIIGKIIGDNLEIINNFLHSNIKNCIIQYSQNYLEIFILKEDFFLNDFYNLKKFHFNENYFIGWGLANTLNEARYFSEISLKENIKTNKNILNLISSTGSLNLYENNNFYGENIDFIKKLDSLNINLEKTKNLIEIFKKGEKITSDKLSQFLNLSLRTTNRLLEKLCKNNIISYDIVKIKKGRPKKFYYLNEI